MLRHVMITGAKRILRRLGLEVHRAINHHPTEPTEHFDDFDWQSALDGTAVWESAVNATAAMAATSNSNPLREFFDSRKQGPGIWKWNHYFDIYDRHFRRFRGQEVHVL